MIDHTSPEIIEIMKLLFYYYHLMDKCNLDSIKVCLVNGSYVLHTFVFEMLLVISAGGSLVVGVAIL